MSFAVMYNYKNTSVVQGNFYESAQENCSVLREP